MAPKAKSPAPRWGYTKNGTIRKIPTKAQKEAAAKTSITAKKPTANKPKAAKAKPTKPAKPSSKKPTAKTSNDKHKAEIADLKKQLKQSEERSRKLSEEVKLQEKSVESYKTRLETCRSGKGGSAELRVQLTRTEEFLDDMRGDYHNVNWRILYLEDQLKECKCKKEACEKECKCKKEV